MISLNRYHLLEDAWQNGVENWCRAASSHVLAGGRAWIVTLSEGHTNWIKRRLLRAGVSLFGTEFLDARSLRQEMGLRAGFHPPIFGRETLELLLRAQALTASENEPQAVAVARHPGACLSALDDLTASSWLDDCDQLTDILSPSLVDWLPQLDRTGFWLQHLDRSLVKHYDPRRRKILARENEVSAVNASLLPSLSVCIFGWDASYWPLLNLLIAATRAADSAYLYLPLPRGTAENIQQAWLDTIAEILGQEFEDCSSSGFESAQSVMTDRLEGTDIFSTVGAPPAEPALLVGADRSDTVNLVRDFAARWLLDNPLPDTGKASARAAALADSARLVILCPCRNASAVAVVRALGAAKIAVEDELGEIPEPALQIQIQRAILDYLLNDTSMDSLLTLVELLNEHGVRRTGRDGDLMRRVFPLDPIEVRRALHGAFSDVQHHNARILSKGGAFSRAKVAGAMRELISHLDHWPEKLPWLEALNRWERCLQGFGLETDALEPLWSQLHKLPLTEPLPSTAFFQYLSGVLGATPARRSPEGAHRFARVVVTTLEGAIGQVWGGAVFLDSLEGNWPLYPAENPFLDDAERVRLNARRTESSLDGDGQARGHLLTSSELAQLEQFRFLEVLENCTGPLAFAGAVRDPAEPNKELYPNEWALRCLVESRQAASEAAGQRLLDRWRQAVQAVKLTPAKLASAERKHLHSVFTDRRQPERIFDDYFLNFRTLTAADELPWSEAWSARDLDAAWNRPATFAMGHVFGVEPWRGSSGGSPVRREDATVGRLVHEWVRRAINTAKEPQQLTAEDWRRVSNGGLTRARQETEKHLLAALHREGVPEGPDHLLPYWWQGVLRKAAWAAERCLETLSETAQRPNPSGNGLLLCMGKSFEGELPTRDGPLHLRAHCDVLLLDRATLPGATCQFIDIRTGSHAAAPPTAANLGDGQGLKLIGLLFLALEEGADPSGIHVGVIHPNGANTSLLDASLKSALEPMVEALARKQRFLVFGQRGGLVAGHGTDQSENLPLATTPIDLAVLERKSALSQ